MNNKLPGLYTYIYHVLVYKILDLKALNEVGGNYPYLLYLKQKICKSCCINTHFIFSISDLI